MCICSHNAASNVYHCKFVFAEIIQTLSGTYKSQIYSLKVIELLISEDPFVLKPKLVNDRNIVSSGVRTYSLFLTPLQNIPVKNCEILAPICASFEEVPNVGLVFCQF